MSELGAAQSFPDNADIRHLADGLEVRVRAGRPDLTSLGVAALFGLWAAGWGYGFVTSLRGLVTGGSANPWPAVVFCAAALAVGLYGLALGVWIMFGHERVVLCAGRLGVGNPWLLGAIAQRYRLDEVGAFQCIDKACEGVQQEGCCCGWSAVNYKLTVQIGRKDQSVFVHLPREAKDRLRDEFNCALCEARARASDRAKDGIPR